MELAGQGLSCPLPGSAQGQAAAEAGGGPRGKWLKFAARAGSGQIVEEELECQLECRPLGARPCPEIWAQSQEVPGVLAGGAQAPLGWAPARPSPPPVPSQRLPSRRAGRRRGRGAAGTASSLLGQPHQPLGPQMLARATPALTLCCAWRLLPRGRLLSLQGPALAEFLDPAVPEAPQPTMPCPCASLLQLRSPGPLPCAGAAHTLLCLLHRAAAAACHGAGWNIQLAPSVCWAWGGHFHCSCLSERPWDLGGSSLSWAAGAAWMQPTAAMAPFSPSGPRVCAAWHGQTWPPKSAGLCLLHHPQAIPAPGASVSSFVNWAEQYPT